MGIIYWAITIFCKKIGDTIYYLVVKNNETGNISFVSWAKEGEDNDLFDTAKREAQEELGIDPTDYIFIPTSVRHEFIFWNKKKERSWQEGVYQVFWVDWSNLQFITPTKELSETTRITREEVLESLTFDDLKEVFKKAIWEIELQFLNRKL